MYNSPKTNGHLAIPKLQFQKKIIQAGDTGLELTEYFL